MKAFESIKREAQENSMFIATSPFGNVVNISNEKVSPLYKMYRTNNKIPYYAPLDDKQRLDFEAYIIDLFFAEFLEWYKQNHKKLAPAAMINIKKIGAIRREAG